MKNQFFADKRDFFKYDLLLEILHGIPHLRQLTFIPMLTKNDRSNHGGQTEYELGNRREDLFYFLRGCLGRSARDIRLLRAYFSNRTFAYSPHRDSNPDYFTHDNRDEYFRSIPDLALRQALVFFDPDTGLKVKSMGPRNGERYLRYSELHAVFERMDNFPVAVVFQYLRRTDRTALFEEIRQKLCSALGVEEAICISDNEIAFFAIPKTPEMAHSLLHLFRDYTTQHGLTLSPS